MKSDAILIETEDGLEIMIGTGIVPNPEDEGTPNITPDINSETCINFDESHCSMFCPCEYAYSS